MRGDDSFLFKTRVLCCILLLALVYAVGVLIELMYLREALSHQHRLRLLLFLRDIVCVRIKALKIHKRNYFQNNPNKNFPNNNSLHRRIILLNNLAPNIMEKNKTKNNLGNKIVINSSKILERLINNDKKKKERKTRLKKKKGREGERKRKGIVFLYGEN